MPPFFAIPRALCAAAAALFLGFSPMASASMLSDLGSLFGSTPSRLKSWAQHPEEVFHWGDWDTIQAITRDGGRANEHPTRISAEQIAGALESVQATSGKGQSVPLFSSEEIARLAPAIALGLAEIGPDQDLAFLITGYNKQIGAFGQKLSQSGRVFFADGQLQLIIGTALSDALLGVAPGGRPKQKIAPGSRGTPSSKVRLQGSAQTHLLRHDWIALGPAEQAAAAASTTSADMSTDAAAAPPTKEDRLQILKRMRDQGLISDAEYEAKRKETSH